MYQQIPIAARHNGGAERVGSEVSPKLGILGRLATIFLLASCFTIPMGVVRIGGFAASDYLFLACASILLISGAAATVQPKFSIQFSVWLLALGIFLSTDPDVNSVANLAEGFKLLFIWTFMLWSLRVLLKSWNSISQVCMAFCLGASVSAIVGVLQVQIDLVVPGVQFEWGRAPGLQYHPNGQGGVLAVAIVLALGGITSGRQRLLNSVIVAICSIGLLLTGSVSGMIAAATGTVIVLIWGRVSIGKIVAAAGLALTILLVATTLNSWLPDAVDPVRRFQDVAGGGRDESTVSNRLQSMQYAWERIRENPLWGYGLDDNSIVQFREGTVTHNFLLYAWVQGGVLVLVAILSMLVSCLERVYRTIRHSHNQSKSRYAVGIWAVLIGLLFFAMTGPVLVERWFWLPFLLGFPMIALQRHECDLPSDYKSFPVK